MYQKSAQSSKLHSSNVGYLGYLIIKCLCIDPMGRLLVYFALSVRNSVIQWLCFYVFIWGNGQGVRQSLR